MAADFFVPLFCSYPSVASLAFVIEPSSKQVLSREMMFMFHNFKPKPLALTCHALPTTVIRRIVIGFPTRKSVGLFLLHYDSAIAT